MLIALCGGGFFDGVIAPEMSEIILFNKPFNVLSQFTDGEARETLANYLSAPRFRAAGRLDYDSEGLLLLTADGQLQQKIANPRHKQWKTYLVQVEGDISDVALEQLRTGVTLKDGATLPARADRIEPPDLWPRNPPVRYRKTIPDSWFSLSIMEGRNRQVRRMTAHVGFPTLRLVRTDIGEWSLGGLKPGEHRKVAVAGTVLPRQRQSNRGKR
ncbi:MAG: 23S rRNA pseudouridine2457 synthase [Halioglobus sp.]|jgi:23S rRNA pseudouridine2457 synthase